MFTSTLQIMIHNSVEDLKNNIDPEILPLDYGGKFPKTVEELSGEPYTSLVTYKRGCFNFSKSC